MPKPSRLDGGLIARKGAAAPSSVPTPVKRPRANLKAVAEPKAEAKAEAAVVPAAKARAKGKANAEADPNRESQPVPRGVAGTIAVTVRLDPARYERLKMHGVRNRETNQAILVAALDEYLP